MMRLRWVLVLVCSMALLWAHPDRVEDRLVFHFGTGGHPIANGQWEDLTHSVTAQVKGAPIVTNLGPAVALHLNGFEDHLVVPLKSEALPKKEISLAAWVFLNDTVEDGGIVSYAQDNGAYEKGVALGYDKERFTFTLVSKEAGKLTRLRAGEKLALGRWHYVVGTYDGETMRLFVNGRAAANSKDQGGEIDYPPRAVFAVGAYIDDNEFYPMDGALLEAKMYARALAESEIAAVAQKNKALIDDETINRSSLKFIVQPYLQFGTRESMTVMCEVSETAQMTVEYGEKQPLNLRATSPRAGLINEVTLSKLKPYTTYFYRVSCTTSNGALARSDIFSFQTAPGKDLPWAFGVIGDTQRNPEITRRCAEGIFALRPNMTIHCGDVVDDGFAKHQWVSDLFEPSARLFAHIPTFPVIGNHEKNAHWYYDYFSMPAPEYYYTFEFGNAQFFMIDSNKDLSPGSEQYKWLERELRKSKATWKFTCHHHPCFSSDENDYGDKWKGKAPEGFSIGDENAQKVVPLYEKYGVDVAFAGHIHSYERTWPILNVAINQRKGVRYVVSGGGGGGLEQAAPQRSWFTIHVQRGHHYCYAAVHDRTIQFKAYDVDGRLFDTFELTKTAK